MPRLIAFLTAALVLAIPATASAAQRYAAPSATNVNGTCPVESPCRIDHAVDAASAGDTVHVAPGTYTVYDDLELVSGATLAGDPGDPAPLLVAAQGLDEEILVSAGTVRHLDFRSLAQGQAAVMLTGGTGEDLTAVADGNAFKVFGNSSGVTLLRDSVALSVSGAGVKLKDGGVPLAGALLLGPADVAVRNVTAFSSQGDAIRCEMVSGRGSLVNVIARGAKDVNASGGGGCRASYSNLRPSLANLALGAGIQSGQPAFGSGARPLASSPTVDAGTRDAFTGAADPDGRARTVPDIGAYECCVSVPPPPAAGGTIETPPTDSNVLMPEPEAATAKLGKAVVVSPASGRIRIRVPGGRFVDLASPTELPVGTVVDASKGRITLVSALDAAGRTQKGRFWGGQFKITQNRKQRGMTTLKLQGGGFSACRPTGKLASAARKKKRPRRSLWASDNGGRFRTHGHNSVATARGTKWLTRDTCAGTLTRVFKDSVAVRDLRAKRTVIVRAGHKYLARR